MSIGIVLGGGGAKGDFQVGVLKYLYENGIKLNKGDVVCGTSVGAINAGGLAEGSGGISKVVNTWLKLNTNDNMYLPESWSTKLLPLLKTIERYTAKHDSMILIENLFSIIQKVKDIFDVINNEKSLYNLNPVENLLRINPDSKLDIQKISNSGIKLRIAVVGLETGKLRHVDESSVLSGVKVDLINAILASAANPAFFPPKKLDNEYYIDGGVRDVLPIQAAIDAGADQIYAISCSKSDVDPEENYDSKNIVDVTLRCLSIVTNEVEERSVHPPCGWGVNVTVIRPYFEIHDGMTIDPGLIRISMAYGYMQADDAIGRIPPTYLEQAKKLTEKIIKLRMDIWRLEPLAGNDFLINSDGKRIPTIPDPDSLRSIRDMKRQLRDYVVDRVNLCGSVPPDVATWWQQWEKHDWTPLISTPWNRLTSALGNVEAETPPPNLNPCMNSAIKSSPSWTSLLL